MILFTQIINFTLQVLIVLLIVQFIRRKEEIVTNKLFVRTICTVLVGITILSAGCGNVGELSDAASIEESTKQKNTDAVLYVPLVAPTVKDGIIELGDGFIPVCFEWNAVEGADGYQIWEESKSRSEETYHEPEYDSASYTSETYYLANVQENNIDFRIKVTVL